MNLKCGPRVGYSFPIRLTPASPNLISLKTMKCENSLKNFAALTSVLDSASVGLAYLDTGRRFIVVNRTYARLLGKLPEDFPGLHIEEFLPKRVHGLAREHH